jgi:endonuclease YncB( thermonuclease family)
MRTLLFISLLVMLPCAALAASPEGRVPGEFEAVVTWVIDGDSIRYKMVGNAPGREPDEKGARGPECRMLHYNAPEMTGRERPEGRKATRKLISLIKNKRVMIWGIERDRYGRLLCEVRLLDGTYINEAMRRFLKGYKKRDIYLWKEKGQKRRGQE